MVVFHKVPLDVVDQVVRFQRVLLGGQLHMDGRKLVAGAVVVHHQIMYAQHAGIAHHSLFDMLHKILAGTFAQQRAQGIHHQPPAGDQDKHCHAHAHQAVQHVPAGHPAEDSGYQHGSGAQHVVAAVGGSGDEGLGGNDASNGAVEAAHPQLDQNGHHQHRHGQPAELHRGGVQHLGDRLLQQGEANAQNGHADHQPRQILKAGVTVGMLSIRCLGGQLKAHQTDDIGGSIRKVIQCIGSDGDRAEQGAYHKLAQTEQDIAHHAHHTGQIAIGGADAGVLRRIGTAYKKTDQKLRHKSSFRAAHFQRTQCPSSIAFYFMVLKAFQKFHPITPDIKPGCRTKSPGGHAVAGAFRRFWDCLFTVSCN